MSLTFLTPVGVVAGARGRRSARGAATWSGGAPDGFAVRSACPSRRGAGSRPGCSLSSSRVLSSGSRPPSRCSQQTKTLRVRTDAEVWFVLDVSRSMLAQADAGSAPTTARPRKGCREHVPGALSRLPVGIASMTTRVLPHLFPGANEDVFSTTLDRSLGIERPPPPSGLATVATDSELARDDPRSALLLTRRRRSGSSSSSRTARAARSRTRASARSTGRRPAIGSIFVHVWDRDERVFTRGAPEAAVSPRPSCALDARPARRVDARRRLRRRRPRGGHSQGSRSFSATGRPWYEVRAVAESRWRRTSRSAHSFR